MDLGLREKVAIVTGGASGIGLRTAEILVEEGVSVFIADLNGSGMENVLRRLRTGGAACEGAVTDVRRYQDCTRMLSSAREAFGEVHMLVNGAGVGEHGFFAETSPDSWDRQIDVNLRGVMNCCRAVSGTLMGQGYGKIVNIASEAGKVGEKRIAVYSATKGGVIAFTKAFALEMGRFHINVNAVCPGVTRTPMTAYLTPQQEQEWSRYYPLGRLGVPDDIAPLIVFLCSDRASWITGQAISVNGGFGRS